MGLGACLPKDYNPPRGDARARVHRTDAIRADLLAFWRAGWAALEALGAFVWPRLVRFRRRFILVRLVVWLAIGAPPIVDAVAVRQEARATLKALDYAMSGGLALQVHRYELQRSRRDLSTRIVAVFDDNHDGRLSRAEAQTLARHTGLRVVPAHRGRALQGRAPAYPIGVQHVRVEGDDDSLATLLRTAQTLGVALAHLTTRDLARAARRTAQRAEDDFLAPWRAERAAYFPPVRPEDFARWEVWQPAIAVYLRSLRRALLLGVDDKQDPFGVRAHLYRDAPWPWHEVALAPLENAASPPPDPPAPTPPEPPSDVPPDSSGAIQR